MGVTLGRLREDTLFDYKFVGLAHNTLRGAAGGAVLTAEEKRILRPSREDVIRVWREIGAGGVSQQDLRPLLLRCGVQKQGAGRIFTALDALQELAHVAVQPTGMFAPTGGQKRGLSESVLLKSLEE